ncbi:hypothetical protein Tco_1190930, partial [Tanacetum coccineum]
LYRDDLANILMPLWDKHHGQAPNDVKVGTCLSNNWMDLLGGHRKAYMPFGHVTSSNTL